MTQQQRRTEAPYVKSVPLVEAGRPTVALDIAVTPALEWSGRVLSVDSTIRQLPVSAPNLGPAEMENVIAAMESTWISSTGGFVDQFEREFAEFAGVRFAVATSSGSTALYLALAAHGVSSGDEVIVPDLTFVAVANAVVHCGATPVLVDISQGSLAMSPDAFEAAITPSSAR